MRSFTKLVENGPITIKYEGMTVKLFKCSKREPNDYPDCNVRIWYKGKETTRDKLIEEDRKGNNQGYYLYIWITTHIL